MGNFSKSLSKRLRNKPADNDVFWNKSPTLNFKKFAFDEKYSLEEWRRINVSHGISMKESDTHYDFFCTMEHWMNDEYWVVLDKKSRRAKYQSFNGNRIWHLEISRRDEQPIRDWQTMQTIKNEIVGKEYEAVELYPAHSRLMDVHNKYHLWVLAPKGDEEPPHFQIGCRKLGAVPMQTVVLTESFLQDLLQDLSDEQRKELRKKSELHDIRVFPETMRVEMEKEFPGLEPEKAMHQFLQKHPECDLQPYFF